MKPDSTPSTRRYRGPLFATVLLIGVLLVPVVRNLAANCIAASSPREDAFRPAAESEASPSENGKLRDRAPIEAAARDADARKRVSKIFVENDFQNFPDLVQAAAATLGADSEQLTEIKAAMEKTREDIWKAEVDHLAIAGGGTEEVRLDLTSMEDSCEAVYLQAQGSIRDILPAEMAATIIKGVRWSSLYDPFRKPDLRLQILRDADGGLRTQLSRVNGFIIQNPVTSGTVSANATEIPVCVVFPRWSHLDPAITLKISG